MNENRKDLFKHAKRIVVKIGSGVLTLNHGLNTGVITSISDQINHLRQDSVEVVIISSGAIATGVKKIGLERRPDGIPARQAASAVGQAGLILEWEHAFSRYDARVAQLLLTREDLSHRRRYLNARNTLNQLLDWKIIPIINENDTVVFEEIKLGDNDNLAAMITLLMDADILINLTDIDGLYDKDPRVHEDARLLSSVSTITEEMEEAAGGIPGNLGTGGMLSKVTAAKKLTRAGIPMIIAGGLNDGIITDLVQGKDKGTFFIPVNKRMNSRKCWIAFNLKPEGAIVLDHGAQDAVIHRGKSILPIGVTDVIGDFSMGAPVDIQSIEGNHLGRGLVNYPSSEIRKIMGLKSDKIRQVLGSKPFDDVIHRDNLAVTCLCDKDSEQCPHHYHPQSRNL
ncbi:gamma-glutamate kinase [Desulfamplus magnetovallimortis]|uniref:Glutamate 5-kinase n=1 Tax=Desulfamplus magnetovallimortis TaxID=1246637 RepID=A0A1W1H9F6_9BACT|nr:glutamate 5-kinase [Desulfamplus magnetovallimortis]SLM29074.1 gamma-glutamate kinase [Desulfamplus magnetovallimortis]